MGTESPQDGRAELVAAAERIEAQVREQIRGIGSLTWVDEGYDGELIGLSALVRPVGAHSGGATVTVYEGDELGLAIGPGEFRFLTHNDKGMTTSLAAVRAAVEGGARVEVYRRWWRTSTRTIVPAYGYPVATSSWNLEFPDYPLGTHIVQPALVTDVGQSGADITHTAGELAIGTAIAGPHVGARVSVTDTGTYWIQWEGPGEQEYSDGLYESVDIVYVLSQLEAEIAWEWFEPGFEAWLAAGREWLGPAASDPHDTDALGSWLERLSAHVERRTGLIGVLGGGEAGAHQTLTWITTTGLRVVLARGWDHGRNKHGASIHVTVDDGAAEAYLVCNFGEVHAVLFGGRTDEPWASSVNDWLVARLASS